jgi:hypothetical protein
LCQLDLVKWLTDPIVIHHNPLIPLFLRAQEPLLQVGTAGSRFFQPFPQGFFPLSRQLCYLLEVSDFLARLLFDLSRNLCLSFGTPLSHLSALLLLLYLAAEPGNFCCVCPLPLHRDIEIQ